MHIHIHIHHHANDELLKSIYKQNQKIMDTQEQLVAKVDAATAKLVKIGEESRKTLQTVAELKEALANQGSVSPELQAAFDRLEVQVGAVDDLVPDAEPPIEGENSGL
jgi:hypothetical protein